MQSSIWSDQEAKALLSRELVKSPINNLEVADLEGAILLGAGVYSRTLLPHLHSAGVTPACFVDSNPQLQNQEIAGVPIRPLGYLNEAKDRLVVVMTHHFKAMAKICVDHNLTRWAWFSDIKAVFGNYQYLCTSNVVLESSEADRFYQIIKQDPSSAAIFKKALSFRVTGDPDDFPPSSGAAYFYEDNIADEAFLRFVDCGAFNGDTLKEWYEIKAKHRATEDLQYYAFEPDALNYEGLQAVVQSLPKSVQAKITLFPFAVGDKEGQINMVHGGLTSSVTSTLASGQSIRVARLDDVLKDIKVSAIKMDLEGYEPEALRGAYELIKHNRPALLIAIYHQVDHLWKIPLWIHDLGLNYKISLGHHENSFSETICYATPE